MKHKFISILLTLVLALSLCLVTAVPVAAADPVRLNLISVGVDSTAEWVDAETMAPQAPRTGAYSLKLYALNGQEVVVGDGLGGGAGVYIPVNVAIEDIDSLSFARLGTTDYKDAKVNLLIDADNDGDLDFTEIEALTYHLFGGDPPLDFFGEDAMLWLNPTLKIADADWATVDVYNTYKYWGTDKTGTLHWTNNAGLGDVGGVQEVGSIEGGAIDPTDKVLGVIVLFGCGSGVADRSVYIDDIKVNGTTYELEEALSGWHVYQGQLIQDAIDTVASGDTINVEAGTYNENILINKALTLTGTDGATETIIDGTGSYIVTIQHSDVTFQGFTVTDPTYAGGADASGILIQTTDPVEVEDVSNVQILDNIVTQIRSETGTPSTFGSCGINIGYAIAKGNTLSDIVISGNTITDIKNPEGGASDHTCGINVWDGAENVLISNNDISDIKFNGIILEHAINVRIEGNSITDCKNGIRVQPSVTVSGLTVNFNNIAGNTEYGVANIGLALSVDAENNWWGTAIESQIAKLVSGNVDYSPWLDAAYPGGVPTSLDVTTISLKSGWNLISLPLIPELEASSIETVLDGISVSKVAYYTGGPEGIWLNYNTIEPGTSDLTEMQDGKGYWIDVSTAGALTIRGYELCAPPPAVPPSYNLVEGWNLIGFKALAIDTAITTYFGKAVMDTMEAGYGYDASAGLYTIIKSTDKLVPGDGYWLAVSADGTIYP